MVLVDVAEARVDPMLCAVLLIVISVGFPAAPAWGILGESVATVEQDQQLLNGQRTTIPEAGYTIEKIQSGEVVVKEYVSPTGRVFGISWWQLRWSYVKSLLGPYYSEYQEALQSQPLSSLHMTQVQTEHLVVEHWSYARAVWGKAWIPSLLPEGVTPNNIQGREEKRGR